jgi:hypothetical protein
MATEEPSLKQSQGLEARPSIISPSSTSCLLFTCLPTPVILRTEKLVGIEVVLVWVLCSVCGHETLVAGSVGPEAEVHERGSNAPHFSRY